jgi:lipoprotein-anchoring transpeptidase ErfK/SrfK
MHEMWHSSKYENAPMPWSIFFYGGYAIHGTTDLKHLGQVASHGCVRLDPENAKLLYDLVKEVGLQNTRVQLIRS